MKVCKECSKEFEPVNQKGSEQVYCSRKCGQKAANKRRIEKLVNSAIQKEEQKPEPITTDENIESGYMERERVGRVIEERRVTPVNDMAYLEKYYEAKIELNLYKLKAENLEQKNQELQREIFDLNSEIDQLEQPDENNSFISGIAEQFKKDPVNTVNMATAIIDNLFKKPKK